MILHKIDFTIAFSKKFHGYSVNIRSTFNWEVIGTNLDSNWNVDREGLANFFTYDPDSVLDNDWNRSSSYVCL